MAITQRINERAYLVHAHIGSKTRTSRIREVARMLKPLLEDICPSPERIYTSVDGTAIGFFIKSTLSAAQITNKLYSPGTEEVASAMNSPFQNGDSLLVVELGDEIGEHGYSIAKSWFKFHRPQTTQESQSQVASDAGKPPSQLADQLSKIKGKLA